MQPPFHLVTLRKNSGKSRIESLILPRKGGRLSSFNHSAMKLLHWIVAFGSAFALAIAVTFFMFPNAPGESRLMPILLGWLPCVLVMVAFFIWGRGSMGPHEDPSIEIRITQAAGFDERFVIKNTSHVIVFDFDMHVVGENQNPIPRAVAMHHLPIEKIPPGGRYEIPISLSADAGMEFDVVANWKNRRGRSFKLRKWVGLTQP